jgi:competence protein ComEA
VLAHYTPWQKLGFYSMGAMILGACAFVGHLHLQARPELVLEEVKDPAALGPGALGASSSGDVVVHVAGAVERPGVFHFSATDRVTDAVERAGGAKKDADLDQINLAAKLVDGAQVFVPSKGPAPLTVRVEEVAEPFKGGNIAATPFARGGSVAATPFARKPTISPRKQGAKKVATHGIVHLNTASKSELDSLPGVGPATAQKIWEYRQEHGGFGSIDELMEVKGIGPKKMEAMRRFLAL